MAKRIIVGTCVVCKLPIIKPEHMGTGYGLVEGNDGEDKVCYSCCASNTRQDMIEDGKTILYLSHRHCANGCIEGVCQRRDHWKITNWPDSLHFDVLQVNHSYQWFAPRGSQYATKVQRTDVWFNGPDGYLWHGMNKGDNELLRCKRTKQLARELRLALRHSLVCAQPQDETAFRDGKRAGQMTVTVNAERIEVRSNGVIFEYELREGGRYVNCGYWRYADPQPKATEPELVKYSYHHRYVRGRLLKVQYLGIYSPWNAKEGEAYHAFRPCGWSLSAWCRLEPVAGGRARMSYDPGNSTSKCIAISEKYAKESN